MKNFKEHIRNKKELMKLELSSIDLTVKKKANVKNMAIYNYEISKNGKVYNNPVSFIN